LYSTKELTMDSVTSFLKAETENHYANVAISTGKFAVSAALAWAILPKIPHPKTAAVIAATVTTLGSWPEVDYITMGNFLGGAEHLPHPFDTMPMHRWRSWKSGLFSVAAGVQAAALLGIFRTHLPHLGASRIARIPVACLITYSATDFIWMKGGASLLTLMGGSSARG
jgi:hypothetical protein